MRGTITHFWIFDGLDRGIECLFSGFPVDKANPMLKISNIDLCGIDGVVVGWTMTEHNNGATYWLTPFDWKVCCDAQRRSLVPLYIDL